MAQPISETSHGDAPLSAAKNPDPRAASHSDAQVQRSDTLIGRTVSVNRPRCELYAFWRDFTNFPLFMENIQSVMTEGVRSHWVVQAPGDRTVEWDSILTQDEPNLAIGWKSDDGATVRNSGRVEFKDSTNGRGTIVTATLIYDPPGGALGKAWAKLFQREPGIQVRRDLRRFKQLMEAGEVSTSEPPAGAPRA